MNKVQLAAGSTSSFNIEPLLVLCVCTPPLNPNKRPKKMFASIVFVVAVSLAAERVAARSVEACLPAKPSCGELSATECASVAACTTNEQSECVCRSDGFGEEYGWTASFACRVGGYDCMEFNEPGVGVIDAAKCPAGACELKTLTGAEADECKSARWLASRVRCQNRPTRET